jgi:hypothetical protein
MQRWLALACVVASGCVINRTDLSTPDDTGPPSIDTASDAFVEAADAADARIPTDVRPDATTPPPDSPPPDAFTCNEGDLRCNGDLVEYCNMEMWTRRADCALGCLPDGMPRCRPFIPSTVGASELNGSLDLNLSDTAPDGTRVVYRINTSVCNSITGVGAAPIPIAAGTVRAVGANCVLSVRSLTVGGENILLGEGTRPLIILATETITIDTSARVTVGALTLTASDTVPRSGTFSREGAGANATTSGLGGPGMSDGGPGDGGGGGGGYCTAGALGGTGASTGSGGLAGEVWGVDGTEAGAIDRRLLRAGSRGGDGSPGTASAGGRGGGGGGAVQLSAGRSITVLGSVAALGGAGEGGTISPTSAGAGGGGGSGGMILVEAPSVSVRDNGLLVGGGGGGGGSCWVRPDGGPVTSNEGEHGDNGGTAATGGVGGVCGATVGGTGGAATSATTPAEPGIPSFNGGGGGAGAGCVSIRTRSGAAFPMAAVPRLPAVTATGTVIGS